MEAPQSDVPQQSVSAVVPQPLPPQHRILDRRDVQLFQVLKIDPNDLMQQIVYGAADNALAQFIETAEVTAAAHKDVLCYQVAPGCKISCVNWMGRHFISGTDIVKFLMQRYESYCGRRPHNPKKFEEGIFSDLRRLQAPRDCQLEGTRSDFLCYLFDYECVRSKKKQKVFLWGAFKRCFDNLFCDALSRELARIEMSKSLGMSIDQFIKSGIVPTGNSSIHDVHRKPLSFDWVQSAASRINSDDNDGGCLMPIVRGDQVHFVRNDVNSLIDRNVRVHMPTRRKCLSADDLKQVDTLCTSMTSKGKRSETVPLGICLPKVVPQKKVLPSRKPAVVEQVDTASESDQSMIPAPRPRRSRTVSKVKSTNGDGYVQTPSLTPNLTGKSVVKNNVAPGNPRHAPYGIRRAPFPFMRRFSVTQSWSREAESDEDLPKSELFKSLQMETIVDMPELSPKRIMRQQPFEVEAAYLLVNMAGNVKN